jgi:hypothetical protein
VAQPTFNGMAAEQLNFQHVTFLELIDQLGHANDPLPKLILGVKFADGLQVIANPAIADNLRRLTDQAVYKNRQ